MQKNDRIMLEITGTSSDGSGVGRYDSMAVFVPLATEGDIIEAHIVKVKKSYAYGKLINIITPSKDRIQSDCSVFSRCGGCVYRHIDYKKECEIKYRKVYDNMKRIGGIDIPPKDIISADNTLHYRNKAQFPVDTNGNTGFFAVHSHRIIKTDNCLLQPVFFSDICSSVTKWINEYNIPVYDEISGKGLLRHIYLRYAEATNETMVVAVINGDRLPKSDEFISAVKSSCDSVKSIQININKKNTNVILGTSCKTIYGQDFITDILCGVKVRLSALSFYQVNRTMAEKLYTKAAEYVKPTDKIILDLYCGAGTIGLSMANRAKEIIGVEIVPEAVCDAKTNAQNNNITNARFICADAAAAAEELAKEHIRPDAVIMDPPRKGCEDSLLKTVANKFSPETIVYVSCDSATLARDCKILTGLGYALKEYTPVDMFPRTSHVETVVQLVRKKPDTYIDITVDMDELDLTSSEAKATYDEIKDYIFDKHCVKVSSLYIAQVKQKHGIIERDCYNNSKKESPKQPQCPPEKVKLIEEALRYFKMIS